MATSQTLDSVARKLEKVLPAGTAPNSGTSTPAPALTPGGSGPKRTRLACMTSGGDSAGMNAAVRAVIKMAIAR